MFRILSLLYVEIEKSDFLYEDLHNFSFCSAMSSNILEFRFDGCSDLLRLTVQYSKSSFSNFGSYSLLRLSI